MLVRLYVNYKLFTRAMITHPHPSSQLTGLLGLCSQSFRWDGSWSSRRVAVHPKPALSQLIWSLDSMLRMMRGTGRRWARVTTVRSTGQICCWANHCVIHALQNACSQCGAWNGTEWYINYRKVYGWDWTLWLGFQTDLPALVLRALHYIWDTAGLHPPLPGTS